MNWLAPLVVLIGMADAARAQNIVAAAYDTQSGIYGHGALPGSEWAAIRVELERVAADRIRDSQGCRSVIPFR